MSTDAFRGLRFPTRPDTTSSMMIAAKSPRRRSRDTPKRMLMISSATNSSPTVSTSRPKTRTAETLLTMTADGSALIPALLDECLKDDLKEKKTWKNLEDAEKQRNCIEAAGQEAYFAAQGHVGMIKKGYKDPYYPYSTRGTIWILK